MYYFSNTAIKEKRDTIILIDTRNTIRAKANVELNDDFDTVEENPLEKAIQSKCVYLGYSLQNLYCHLIGGKMQLLTGKKSIHMFNSLAVLM